MNSTPQVFNAWRRTCWPACLCVFMVLGFTGQAGAHDLFTAYIQHSVRVTASTAHIDVVIELTFFEEWSARERAAMDADTNGVISRAEIESYVKKLASRAAGEVQLSVAGRALELVPLYDPELDLLGKAAVGPHHHRLRLTFFAAPPGGLRPGDRLVLDDRLWPQAKALATLEAKGEDGCIATPEKLSDPAFAPARPGEGRRFEIICVKPPHARTPAHSPGSAARLNQAQTSP